jgi:single-stranded DNA-specific DHH superfamily exonuclease
MPKITFDQAKEFLNKINSDDSIAIIHHDDLDGFASGILLYDWCKEKGAKAENFIFHIGESLLEDFKLKKFNKILFTDVAPNTVAPQMDPLKEKEVFYTDHHIKDAELPEFVMELTTKGKFPSTKTVYELVGGKEWLAIAGIVDDAGWKFKENLPLINSFLGKEKLTLEEFKEDYSHELGYFLKSLKKDQEKALEILKKINSLEEIEKVKKYTLPIKEELKEFEEKFKKEHEELGEIKFFYGDPKICGVGMLINKISYENPSGIFIFAKPSGKMVKISTRNQDGKMSMPDLLKIGAEGLEGASYGGHRQAAGGQIQTKDLKKFKENLRNFTPKQ